MTPNEEPVQEDLEVSVGQLLGTIGEAINELFGRTEILMERLVALEGRDKEIVLPRMDIPRGKR